MPIRLLRWACEFARPSRTNDVLGAAHYFLGDYEKAVDHYVAARDHGEDPHTMDYNIWEACEAAYGSTRDAAHLHEYKELGADGKYVKKADKLLRK